MKIFYTTNPVFTTKKGKQLHATCPTLRGLYHETSLRKRTCGGSFSQGFGDSHPRIPENGEKWKLPRFVMIYMRRAACSIAYSL